MTAMIGMLGGLGAAVGQSLSYLGTRHYVQQRGAGASRELFVYGHLWMALFGLVALPFCWPAAGLPWHVTAVYMPINIILYIIGQMFCTAALKHGEASRVAPLFTAKVIFSSLIVLFLGQPVGDASRWLTLLQWIGLLLCTVAGISTSYAGGRIPRRALGAALITSLAFAISDWSINLTIAAYLDTGATTRIQACLLTQAFSYIGTGVLALPLLKWVGRPSMKDTRDAFPFAAFWFGSMLGLFWGFATVGILLTTILQCTRGFMSILLAAAIMKLGHHHIEPHAPRHVVMRRFAAGFLMFLGISLYILRNPATFRALFAGD